MITKRNWIMSGLLGVAVVMVVAGSSLRAGQPVRMLDAPPDGSISGLVTGADGKPAAMVIVKVVLSGPQAGSVPDGDLKDVLFPVEPTLLGRGETTIASARTDANGKYLLKKVRVGKFQLVVPATARTKASRADVTVEGGKNTVVDLKLESRNAS